MHWPSFLAGLLVLPAFVLFAGLSQQLLQAWRRRQTSYVSHRSATPLARGAEPLEFGTKLMDRIGHSDSKRSPRGSARAS